MPGCGCLIASLERSMKGPADDIYSESKSTIITGKPNALFFNQILEKYNFDKKDTVMIGDRLDTDILFGNNVGVDTALVLSGASVLKDVQSLQAGDNRTPTYVSNNLEELLEM
mmetsp:Transcript_10326/g.12887  ORF Transcript_10326/g.12887 Transcript_10326/m.12887 type:complete len:113 (+) Transcript_10326:300-638(+)